MIDIDTHRMLDMINSRNHDEVADWLAKFPNLKVISRDGSLTYKKAITTAHENAIQVSDRFHILKNLTSSCKDYLIKHLKNKVSIQLPLNSKLQSECSKFNIPMRETLKSRYFYAMDLYNNGINKNNCCKLAKIDIRLFNRLLPLSADERLLYFKSKKKINHINSVAKKEESINLVRELYKSGISIRGIAREYNISRETIRKYLKEDATAIHGAYGTTKAGGILSAYSNKINECILLNFKFSEIENAIRKLGYNGSTSSLRKYVSREKSILKEQCKDSILHKKDTIFIERKIILKLLFKPISLINDLDETLFKLLCEQYDVVIRILSVISKSRGIISEQAVHKLDSWIEESLNLGINEVQSFINGLKQDIEAVKNDISLKYNNGLAEGSVNKIKVIKRIMYGRCSFDTLRKKVLNLEGVK